MVRFRQCGVDRKLGGRIPVFAGAGVQTAGRNGYCARGWQLCLLHYLWQQLAALINTFANSCRSLKIGRRGSACKFFKGGRKGIPVVKAAAVGETPEVKLQGISAGHQLLAMLHSEPIE